jgi:hypothetical protein
MDSSFASRGLPSCFEHESLCRCRLSALHVGLQELSAVSKLQLQAVYQVYVFSVASVSTWRVELRTFADCAVPQSATM